MSVLIGLHIKRTLEKNPDVVKMVSNRIYPIVVPQGVETYPFICYDMTGGSGESTKDGAVDDVATVTIAILAKKYEDAIKIGNAVRYALDGYCPKYDEFRIVKTGNIVYNDEYVEAIDAYSLNISVDFRTIDL
jgi:hypothetical protein